MNQLIVDVLQRYADIIRRKLPPAFAMVEQSFKGPEVGIGREQIPIAMFMAFVRQGLVQPVSRSVDPDIDCYIGGQALSIKTVSGSGGIRIKWTANADKAYQFIRDYRPISDLLVVRLVWGGQGYMSYIPIEAQLDIFDQLGRERYLDYRATTNTRGINLSADAYRRLRAHDKSKSIDIRWDVTGTTESPYQRWVTYWLTR